MGWGENQDSWVRVGYKVVIPVQDTNDTRGDQLQLALLRIGESVTREFTRLVPCGIGNI